MKQYKQIKYNNYTDISLVEFDLHENEIHKIEDFILKVSEFIELVGHKEPNYVLFNKQKKDFEISKEFHKFTHKLILDTIFSYRVREVFFLVNEQRYEKYVNILRPHIFAFKEINDVFKHIENNNKANYFF